MTPRNLIALMADNPDIDRMTRKSKRAGKAVDKAKRKLRQALKSKRLTDIRILLGMAQVAIDKAALIAKIGE